MAVYTNNLKLKEIADGAESGSWGASTNTNLDLIAQAFGYASYNFVEDRTLVIMASCDTFG